MSSADGLGKDHGDVNNLERQKMGCCEYNKPGWFVNWQKNNDYDFFFFFFLITGKKKNQNY